MGIGNLWSQLGDALPYKFEIRDHIKEASFLEILNFIWYVRCRLLLDGSLPLRERTEIIDQLTEWRQVFADDKHPPSKRDRDGLTHFLISERIIKYSTRAFNKVKRVEKEKEEVKKEKVEKKQTGVLWV